MHEIVVLALPSVVSFEVGLPHQLIGRATDDAGTPLYRVRVATLDGGPVRTSAGFAVLPDHDASIVREADTLVVPGVQRGSAVERGVLDDDLAAVLAGFDGRLMSICTGAFVLAAAGRLDGRPATTHWMHAERFRALFPRVLLDPDVLYVDDGDILTSAGNAAGIDLCLHLVRRDHGAAAANRSARRTVVAPWREGGQSQFAERSLRSEHRPERSLRSEHQHREPVPAITGDLTAATRGWALDHLSEPVTLADLAAHAAMSVRTFTRRFRDETGVSPARWLIERRVELARRLLEGSDLPVDQVAQRAGFGTAVSLRQHLQATVGVAPLAYRRTYRGRAG